jgi:hypothetical protein
LRLSRLRRTLTLLLLTLGLARHEPAGLVLRCRHHREGKQSGKD